MRSSFSLVDLFSGAGGFARGFKQAGFRVLLAVDSFVPAARSYKANFPEAVVLAEDIKQLSGADIAELVGEPDVVIGSPPCEPFTGANPRRMPDPLDRLYKDPVGQLVLHFARIVADLRPRAFVMENVPGIAEPRLRRAVEKEFRKAGYRRVFFNVLRAEDYGTPSHRVRVFVSNCRLAPRPVRRRVTVWEAIGDLAEAPAGSVPNHEVKMLPEKKARKVARLRWGSAMIYYRGARRSLPNLIRLHPRRVAPTVLGSSRFIHPYEDRLLTVREQARLMGFPDYHVFLGGRDEQYNQVGEAVPVPLAYALAADLLDKLKSGECEAQS